MLYFLRFLAISFLVLFLLGLISRLLLQLFVKRMGKRYGWNQSSQSRPEGDVTVNQTHQQNKMVNKDIGEYVDFEEIKDKKP